MSEITPLSKEEIQQLAAEILDSDPIMSPPVSSESEEEFSESSDESLEDSLAKCCNCPRYINLQLVVGPECKLTEKELVESITEYVKTLSIPK